MDAFGNDPTRDVPGAFEGAKAGPSTRRVSRAVAPWREGVVGISERNSALWDSAGHPRTAPPWLSRSHNPQNRRRLHIGRPPLDPGRPDPRSRCTYGSRAASTTASKRSRSRDDCRCRRWFAARLPATVARTTRTS